MGFKRSGFKKALLDRFDRERYCPKHVKNDKDLVECILSREPGARVVWVTDLAQRIETPISTSATRRFAGSGAAFHHVMSEILDVFRLNPKRVMGVICTNEHEVRPPFKDVEYSISGRYSDPVPLENPEDDGNCACEDQSLDGGVGDCVTPRLNDQVVFSDHTFPDREQWKRIKATPRLRRQWNRELARLFRKSGSAIGSAIADIVASTVRGEPGGEERDGGQISCSDNGNAEHFILMDNVVDRSVDCTDNLCRMCGGSIRRNEDYDGLLLSVDSARNAYNSKQVQCVEQQENCQSPSARAADAPMCTMSRTSASNQSEGEIAMVAWIYDILRAHVTHYREDVRILVDEWPTDDLDSVAIVVHSTDGDMIPIFLMHWKNWGGKQVWLKSITGEYIAIHDMWNAIADYYSASIYNVKCLAVDTVVLVSILSGNDFTRYFAHGYGSVPLLNAMDTYIRARIVPAPSSDGDSSGDGHGVIVRREPGRQFGERVEGISITPREFYSLARTVYLQSSDIVPGGPRALVNLLKRQGAATNATGSPVRNGPVLESLADSLPPRLGANGDVDGKGPDAQKAMVHRSFSLDRGHGMTTTMVVKHNGSVSTTTTTTTTTRDVGVAGSCKDSNGGSGKRRENPSCTGISVIHNHTTSDTVRSVAQSHAVRDMCGQSRTRRDMEGNRAALRHGPPKKRPRLSPLVFAAKRTATRAVIVGNRKVTLPPRGVGESRGAYVVHTVHHTVESLYKRLVKMYERDARIKENRVLAKRRLTGHAAPRLQPLNFTNDENQVGTWKPPPSPKKYVPVLRRPACLIEMYHYMGMASCIMNYWYSQVCYSDAWERWVRLDSRDDATGAFRYGYAGDMYEDGAVRYRIASVEHDYTQDERRVVEQRINALIGAS